MITGSAEVVLHVRKKGSRSRLSGNLVLRVPIWMSRSRCYAGVADVIHRVRVVDAAKAKAYSRVVIFSSTTSRGIYCDRDAYNWSVLINC